NPSPPERPARGRLAVELAVPAVDQRVRARHRARVCRRHALADGAPRARQRPDARVLPSAREAATDLTTEPTSACRRPARPRARRSPSLPAGVPRTATTAESTFVHV